MLDTEYLERLREKIKCASHHYYILDSPVIDDWQYDEWMRELEHIENTYPDLITEDSPTQLVGAPLDGSWGKFSL